MLFFGRRAPCYPGERGRLLDTFGQQLTGNILCQYRSLEGVFEEWQFDAEGAFTTYCLWAASSKEGLAEAKDMLKRVEKNGAHFILTTFKDGASVGQQVMDAVGHVINEVGHAFQKAVDSIKLIHFLLFWTRKRL
jgi:hypothetical protein